MLPRHNSADIDCLASKPKCKILIKSKHSDLLPQQLVNNRTFQRKTDSSNGSKCCYKTPPLHHPNPNKADSSHLGIEGFAGFTAFKHLQQQLQFSTQLADSLSAQPKARPEVSNVAPHPWNQTPNFFASVTSFQRYPLTHHKKNIFSIPFLFPSASCFFFGSLITPQYHSSKVAHTSILYIQLRRDTCTLHIKSISDYLFHNTSIFQTDLRFKP